MNGAYSDFFSSGYKNASSHGRPPRMSLDISMATTFDPAQLTGSSQMSSPTMMDSPVLRSPVPEEGEMDTTPTLAYAQQRPAVRRRRSSLSLAVGAQGNASAFKSPVRAAGTAYSVSRSRSGSVTQSPIGPLELNNTGRARSGSVGFALKSHKRRSLKALAAPPLPPPKAPLPDLPSIAAVSFGSCVPASAPAHVLSFSARPPLAKRVSPSQAPMSPAMVPSPDDGYVMKSPSRDTFDLGKEDVWMKEN